MCGFSDVRIYSFKWMTYLFVILGSYTFIHWFLAVPLVYSHLYENCHGKCDRNWVFWFLGIAFDVWLAVTILTFLVWFCLRRCFGKRLDGSGNRTGENSGAGEGGSGKWEKPEVGEENGLEVKLTDSKSEILNLPKMNLPQMESFAVLKVNDSKKFQGGGEEEEEERGGGGGGGEISTGNFPIPMDEIRHFVQAEKRKSPGKPGNEQEENENPGGKPLKSPREIFFKDLIESAARSPPPPLPPHLGRNSYFDFDLEKISKKSKETNLEKIQAESGAGKEKTFFLASPHCELENSKSEIFLSLDENGQVIEESIDEGGFRVLK